MLDYADRYDLARARLRRWLDDGKIRCRYDFVDGFDNQPEAFVGLFKGDNTGKRLVRI